MGADFPSKIDYLVILSNADIPAQETYQIVLDADSKADILKQTKAIAENYPEIKNIPLESSGMQRISGMDLFLTILTVNSILLIAISIFTCMSFWYRMKQEEIQVLTLLGQNRYRVLSGLLLEALGSMIVALLVSHLFIATFLNMSLIWQKAGYLIFAGISGCGLLSILISFFFPYQIQKQGERKEC